MMINLYMEYSQSVKRILERSIEYAKDKNQDQVTLNILIISLLKEKESVAYEILQKYHVDVEEVIYLLQENLLLKHHWIKYQHLSILIKK